MHDKEFSALESKLKVPFKKQDLLVHAFVHRSYLNENPGFYLQNNERLEFLGDAVLELVVTEDLYKRYPDKPEGEMTSWRAALVNSKMLAETAKELGFNDFLLLSKGETRETGKARDYILANTFEAYVGALYLDQGLKSCEKFIQQHLLPKLAHVLEAELFRDAKSQFQENAQEREGITPTYKSLEEWGPDHQKKFKVGVFLNDKKIAEGQGSSKQEAEENAARNALTTSN
ncbi:MAG: ribonuclease III [Candidatus Wildermuthbacteria bacterium]|nr:ribonuclease III [Candidatus Wildermuthbacteria bacterium]